MKINFLEAAVPLTKTFNLDNGVLTKVGHPRVIDYVSYEESWAAIEDLHGLLVKHAAVGRCLIKGTLLKVLKDESRAGTTDPNAPTWYLCLDLDGLKGVDDVEAFLRLVGLDGVDYIVQYSSSMGVIPARGISAHVFILLSKPYPPALLKQWLMHLNLTIPILRQNFGLSRTGNSLRWVLDTTTCQNDKLIYIAPPLLGEGVVDGFQGERIQLVKKQNRTYTLPSTMPTAEANKVAADTALNELREKAGLPKRPKQIFKKLGTTEYMAKPDQAIISSMKTERGFVYMNLNDGDSWGYYHPENNPMFIHNFKGEPVFKTSELLPDYWADVRDNINAPRIDSTGKLFLAFRDFRTAAYWNGTWDPTTDRLTIAQAKSAEQLRHFLVQNYQPVGDYVPDWNMRFDPHSDTTVDVEARSINTFEPTDLMRMPHKDVHEVPPMIRKVLLHALGSDEESLEHYLNWLAVIFKYRIKAETMWVLHGVPGTGKGLMLNYILRPLFGKHVESKRTRELHSDFNGFLERALILWIDEAEVALHKDKSMIEADLKNYSVEPMISIRRMHMLPYEAVSYISVILSSNKGEIINIDPKDRRFNVAVFQGVSMEEAYGSKPTDAEMAQLKNEIVDFAHYLMTRKADKQLARTALNNQAKQHMIHVSMSSIDIVSRALREGDFQFLWELRSVGETPLGQTAHGLLGESYEGLLRDVAMGKKPVLLREELRTVFEYTVGKMSPSPHKFTSQIKHHDISLEPMKMNGESVRGFRIKWKISDELRKEVLK